MKSKTGEPSKKPKYGDLPDGIDYKVWCQVFIPTFMKWVSRKDSPFKHNPKHSCEVMQSIWAVLFDDIPHIVVQSSPVYTLVSNHFKVLQTFNLYFVTDCTTCIWLLAKHYWLSCNLHLNLKDLDEACQEFATFYLEHLHFLYEKSDGNDPEVSTLFYLTYEVYA